MKINYFYSQNIHYDNGDPQVDYILQILFIRIIKLPELTLMMSIIIWPDKYKFDYDNQGRLSF